MRIFITIYLTIMMGFLLTLTLHCEKLPTSPDNLNISYGSVTDIDGNLYQTVKIGNQEWMAENLRVTRYNDSSPISFVADSSSWNYRTIPGYCIYEEKLFFSDSVYRVDPTKFGLLYNWYVINTGKLAPVGWHVPDTADWNVLERTLFVHGYNYDGTSTKTIAKALASKTDWNTTTKIGAIGNDLSANNASGFSALPSGLRWDRGSYSGLGGLGYWWTSSNANGSYAYYCNLWSGSLSLEKYVNFNSKSSGFSVRLVKD